jgi:two-component system OmpR family response regulator
LELVYEGYQVSLAQNGIQGLLMIRQSRPDLVLLNGSLGDLSSLEICRRLRLTGSAVPILVITAADSADAPADQDRIAHLQAGATDALSYPLNLEELLARIQVQLERFYPEQFFCQKDSKILRFENVTLNSSARQVYRGGQPVNLTAREFDLLAYFMEHPHQVLTQTQILDAVWGYDTTVYSNVIEVYMGYLRRKLEAVQSARLIHTVRGVGYVLRMGYEQ